MAEKSDILVSEKALRHAFGRFGKPDVVKVLELFGDLVTEGTHRTPEGILRALGSETREPSPKLRRRIQIAEVLLQDSTETESLILDLLEEINGVSEPATVPRQTSQAEVTPRDSGENGDLREKHQLS